MPHDDTFISDDFDDAVIDGEDLVRLPVVQRMLGGCSRASIWRYVAAGKLPEPIHLGRHALWPRAELRRYVAALLAARCA